MKVYVGFVAAAGAVLIAPLAWITVDWVTLIVLAIMNVAAEGVTRIRVGRGVMLSVAFPIALAGVLLLPPSGAALVVLLGALSAATAGLPWIKAVFNAAMYACSAAAAGIVYELAGG
ncbi:MAG TPA: hypothetical protein VHO00_11905, partial [Actinomycetes bacterium]|nr:hypothetical protein [Actinomycetes bacterium]